MMKHFLIPIFFALVSCDPKPSDEGALEEVQQPLDPTLFAPKIGQAWVFHQTSRAIPINTSSLGKPSEIKRESFRNIRRYEGPVEIEGKTYYRFSIKNKDKVRPDLLLGYQGGVLFVVTHAQPDGSFQITKPPIPIAQKGMGVGAFWRWPPDAEGVSGFRTVSFEEVRVPAGVFDAYKVTYQGKHMGKISLKDYWFAPSVGIIREESRTYSGGLLRAQSVIELEHILQPGEAIPELNP